MADLDRRMVAVANPVPFSLLLIDLRAFKNVNDTLGHRLGDEVMVQWSLQLVSHLRKGDLGHRLGGDQFGVILDGIGEAGLALATAAKLHLAMSQPIIAAGRPIQLGFDIGIALAPEQGGDPQVLQRHADWALSEAKKEGQGTIRIFDSALQAQHERQRLLETDLRAALAAREGLHLDFQPKIDLQTHRPAGFEALVRWNHPILGAVNPGEFIPVAEDCGLIVPLGQFVIHEAVRWLKEWCRLGVDRTSVAINLPAAQLVHGDVVADVLSCLDEAGLDPRMLQIEITESLLMRDVRQTASVLARFRSEGMEVAIDDFGTGFSSLSYLARLPFDTLKIDRSFVIAMDQGEAGVALVRSIIEIAHHLNAKVVAGGIETTRQLQVLTQMACDQGQGNHLGRPMSGAQAQALLLAGIGAAAA